MTNSSQNHNVGSKPRLPKSQLWDAFTKRPRKVIEIGATVGEEVFWRDVAAYARQVGPDAVMVLSSQAEGRTLRTLMNRVPREAPNLKIVSKPRDIVGRFYIATIEDIDVYGGIFSSGTAWLFLAGALCKIHYSPVDEAGRFLDLSFEIGDDLNGTLRASFIQSAVWADTPVFELHFPVSGS